VEIEEISRTFSRTKALNQHSGSSSMRVGVLPSAGADPIVLGNGTPRQCQAFEGLMADFGYRPVQLRRYTRGIELDVVFVPEGQVGDVLRTL
jgi:hypothetical protein